MKPGKGNKKGSKSKRKISDQSVILIVAGILLVYISVLSLWLDLDLVEQRRDDGSSSSSSATTSNRVGRRRNSDSDRQSYLQQQQQQPQQKPVLTDYVQGWNITHNVNWLLSFSIVAFPKCGTSSLMLYLKNQTDSIFMFDDERCELGWNQQVPLLKDLYSHYQPHLHMGIKCPRDLEVDLALTNYRTYFSKTKFIVGLRHPVMWFESFYNHRIHNEFPMPSPHRLIGKCKKSHQGVCTDRANFTRHLQRIDDEPSRQVFLYEVSQLYDDSNKTAASVKDAAHKTLHETKQLQQQLRRADTFRTDLQDFLELEVPLQGRIDHVKPGRKPMSEAHEQELASKKIDICDQEHQDVRTRLQQQASESATWIQTVFLRQNPNVRVSSPKYFSQLLSAWHQDPCEDRKRKENDSIGLTG